MCLSAENGGSKPPPLPVKRVTGASRLRASEFRARKNGISEQKITPDGAYTVSEKKLCQCYFLNNSVKHWPI